jgi:hypothetical protein
MNFNIAQNRMNQLDYGYGFAETAKKKMKSKPQFGNGGGTLVAAKCPDSWDSRTIQ